MFLTLRTFERDIIINVHRSSCKVPLLLSEFYETSIFSTYFQKNPQISNFMTVHEVGGELLLADRGTEGQRDKGTD